MGQKALTRASSVKSGCMAPYIRGHSRWAFHQFLPLSSPFPDHMRPSAQSGAFSGCHSGKAEKHGSRKRTTGAKVQNIRGILIKTQCFLSFWFYFLYLLSSKLSTSCLHKLYILERKKNISKLNKPPQTDPVPLLYALWAPLDYYATHVSCYGKSTDNLICTAGL